MIAQSNGLRLITRPQVVTWSLSWQKIDWILNFAICFKPIAPRPIDLSPSNFLQRMKRLERIFKNRHKLINFSLFDIQKPSA